jgi:hypothetical protein
VSPQLDEKLDSRGLDNYFMYDLRLYFVLSSDIIIHRHVFALGFYLWGQSFFPQLDFELPTSENK